MSVPETKGSKEFFIDFLAPPFETKRMSRFVYEPTASWIDHCNLNNFLKQCHLSHYNDLLEKSQKDPLWYWTEALRDQGLQFRKSYEFLLQGTLPSASWAVGGTLSIVENCIDRHLKNSAHEPAIIWESDTGEQSHTWTFADLARETSWMAEEFRRHGAQTGDRVAILMPMSLEMVACFFGAFRAGLSVIPIFSGFGAEAIAARLQDSAARFVCVQDVTTRRGKEVAVRKTLEDALRVCPSVDHTFVLKRADFLRGHTTSRIYESVATAAEAAVLYLYTSGTTGKPKACVHTPFGVLATTGKELRYSFDLQKGDRFFWYTDIGWMMGPWELFGSLQYGNAVVLFEGTPDFPQPDRLWQIIERHHVTHLGISPTAVRVLKKAGDKWLGNYDLSSLRILGSTGEPWDQETWLWFFEKIGNKRCPIMNISGGTEIMGCLLSPTPLSPLKATSLGGPVLGADVRAVSEEGRALKQGLGHLVCKTPLPSMTKGFLNSYDRYLETYFSRFDSQTWYHGDWAYIDEDGQWFLKGRSDDTIKIAGKRVGPNEYESALMNHPRVAEAAAIGLPHSLKGEGVTCFVVLKDLVRNDHAALDTSLSATLKAELEQRVVETLGKAFAAEDIHVVDALPKTRSGKILRGLIKKILLGQSYDDSAAENPKSLKQFLKLPRPNTP